MTISLEVYDKEGGFLWERFIPGVPTVKDAMILAIDHADFDSRIGRVDVVEKGTGAQIAELHFPAAGTAHFRNMPDAWVLPRPIEDSERGLHTQFTSKYAFILNPDYKEK
jgi:hypothetical protein